MTELNPAQREAIIEAVHEVLFQLGIDVTDNDGILEHRKDQAFVREWRESVAEVKRKTFLASIAFLGTAFLGWLAMQLSR